MPKITESVLAIFPACREFHESHPHSMRVRLFVVGSCRELSGKPKNRVYSYSCRSRFISGRCQFRQRNSAGQTVNKTTRTIVSTALAADSSVSQRVADHALQLLDSGETGPAPLGRVVRTSEASQRLGVTSKTLRLWALRGALVPVFGGQQKRRCGYTEESVRAILAGKGGQV